MIWKMPSQDPYHPKKEQPSVDEFLEILQKRLAKKS